ncbi:MAG: hypothetical protein D6679_12285 [Candidatus Hydrogenedentota bacterium]|nr:MAG: hypothetical protein D6679_12285 [Candidatus Hydrogenedentota bacterium]
MGEAVDLCEVYRKHEDVFNAFGELREYAAEKVLFREGEMEADDAYLILGGTIRVSRQVRSKEKELAVLGAGEIVGEVALFSGGPRTATARCIEEARVLRLTRRSFEKLRSSRLDVAYELLEGILGIVTQRLRRTIDRLEVIYFWLT